MDTSHCNTTDSLIGVIMDVSGSMNKNFNGKFDSKDNLLRSTFNVVDSFLEKNDITERNKIFVIGAGACRKSEIGTFDLLCTIEKCQNGNHEETICRVLNILKENGAPLVNKWASSDKVMEAVSFHDGKYILQHLKADKNLTRKVATEILPESCRSSFNKKQGVSISNAKGLFYTTFNHFTKASIEDIIDINTKIKALCGTVSKSVIINNQIGHVDASSVKSLRDAAVILRGSVGMQPSKGISQERINEVMEVIEPFVFGKTPLIEALNKSKKIFSTPQYKKFQKFLFVLSDGGPTDGDKAPIYQLEELGVKTISCFITQNDKIPGLQLFSTMQDHWGKPAEFMFKLSSEIKTELLPRTIFIKRGWKVEKTNNRIKLFVQVNNPTFLDETASFFHDMLTSRDALADALSSVSLDLYINQTKQNFKAPLQIGGTCYANAAATVLHLAMHRIVGRDGGYPKFDDLRNEIIEQFGKNGANTENVLKKLCPLYRLHVSEVKLEGALSAITSKRPVVATFKLDGRQWDSFSMFFHENPSGIITKEELMKFRNVKNPSESGGHAVVLTSYSAKSLLFMNSWGCRWGNKGFFRVSIPSVLDFTFYDVYWTLNDLSAAEKVEYGRSSQAIVSKLMEHFQSLKTTNITCPKCNYNSKVVDFSGTFDNINCPECISYLLSRA